MSAWSGIVLVMCAGFGCAAEDEEPPGDSDAAMVLESTSTNVAETGTELATDSAPVGSSGGDAPSCEFACACGVYCTPVPEDDGPTCLPCHRVDGCLDAIGLSHPGCDALGSLDVYDGVRDDSGQCCYPWEAREGEGPTSG